MQVILWNRTRGSATADNLCSCFPSPRYPQRRITLSRGILIYDLRVSPVDEPWVLMIPAMDNLHLQIRSVLRLAAAQRERELASLFLLFPADCLLFGPSLRAALQRGGVIARGLMAWGLEPNGQRATCGQAKPGPIYMLEYCRSHIEYYNSHTRHSYIKQHQSIPAIPW